jgi:hypothetical protein
MARRLDIDPRTVRRYVRRIAEGVTGPGRIVLPSKLDPFAAAIRAKAEQGLSAVQIYQDLCVRILKVVGGAPGGSGSQSAREREERPSRSVIPPDPA